MASQAKPGVAILNDEIAALTAQESEPPNLTPSTQQSIFSAGLNLDFSVDGKKIGFELDPSSGLTVDAGSERLAFSLDQAGNIGVTAFHVGATTNGELDIGPVNINPDGTITGTLPGLSGKLGSILTYEASPTVGVNVPALINSDPAVAAIKGYNQALNNIATDQQQIATLKNQIQVLNSAAAFFGNPNNFPQYTTYVILPPGAS